MLNLITDAWIPVTLTDGSRKVIAPWQMAESNAVRPDWPRPDLNLACLELLIGLVFMADPPLDVDDWEDRAEADPDRLRSKLLAYAPAFNLLGDGPRFLQDLEEIEGESNSVDMLFIDSAGASTANKNADLLVHRDRYASLELPLAAMALFTFQAHAPSGGAGNRTSLRGGGPLVTLLDPQQSLWRLVWANMPDGKPSDMDDLPWMRPTVVSNKEGTQVQPKTAKRFDVEAFFGMPRRLRLVEKDGLVTGVIQRPWGTNYALWQHPLTPYYRMKAGEELLPKHPRAGHFGYRNWLGIVARAERSDLAERALVVENNREGAALLVGGWAMDNMKPRDFTLSHQPFYQFNEAQEKQLRGLVEAAEIVGVALRSALAPVLSEGEAREAERETFFIETEEAFFALLPRLRAGEDLGAAWLQILKTQATKQFESLALQGLDQRDVQTMQKILNERKSLNMTLAGHSKLGRDLLGALGLPLPVKKKRRRDER